MAQVYLTEYHVLESHSTGQYVSWADSNGNTKTWTDSTLALDEAKANFPNGKYKVVQTMKVDTSDDFDVSA